MRFVPNHYYRELYQRLRSLSQSTKSVHEYFKEIKLIMIQANVKEDKKTTMTRFMNDLNNDIAYIMELEEMMHIIMKIESHLKRKGTIWQSQLLGPLTPWEPN